MKKIALLSQYQAFYKQPKNRVDLVDVPAMQFLMIDGRENPNDNPDYTESVAALYAVAYTLKFMVKKGPLEIDYKVMPLEGLWWAENMGEFSLENRKNWQWTMMIMQPEFVNDDMFKDALEKAKQKKDNEKIDLIRFESFKEGPCMQIFHQGPYGEGERDNINKLHAYISEQGYRLHGKHHEIYFNSPLKAAPENLKTIIRQPVSQNST